MSSLYPYEFKSYMGDIRGWWCGASGSPCIIQVFGSLIGMVKDLWITLLFFRSSSPSDQNLHLISNSIHLKNSNEEVVLPPTLNKLHGHANKGCIISLQEYCLRIVYSMIYRLNRLNSSCLQNQISNILPVNITNLFLDGPTALCHRCKKPIFREAIMILFSRAIPLMNLNLIKKMKLTVFFCERSCYYESDFLEKDSILQREIEWVS